MLIDNTCNDTTFFNGGVLGSINFGNVQALSSANFSQIRFTEFDPEPSEVMVASQTAMSYFHTLFVRFRKRFRMLGCQWLKLLLANIRSSPTTSAASLTSFARRAQISTTITLIWCR
jgi:hypothetical protein